ncbi:MAG: hypothetical protein MJ252_01810 [archaeon]|nr:hypothetical protein [archaeon]
MLNGITGSNIIHPTNKYISLKSPISFNKNGKKISSFNNMALTGNNSKKNILSPNKNNNYLHKKEISLIKFKTTKNSRKNKRNLIYLAAKQIAGFKSFIKKKEEFNKLKDSLVNTSEQLNNNDITTTNPNMEGTYKISVTSGNLPSNPKKMMEYNNEDKYIINPSNEMIKSSHPNISQTNTNFKNICKKDFHKVHSISSINLNKNNSKSKSPYGIKPKPKNLINPSESIINSFKTKNNLDDNSNRMQYNLLEFKKFLTKGNSTINSPKHKTQLNTESNTQNRIIKSKDIKTKQNFINKITLNKVFQKKRPESNSKSRKKTRKNMSAEHLSNFLKDMKNVERDVITSSNNHLKERTMKEKKHNYSNKDFRAICLSATDLNQTENKIKFANISQRITNDYFGNRLTSPNLKQKNNKLVYKIEGPLSNTNLNTESNNYKKICRTTANSKKASRKNTPVKMINNFAKINSQLNSISKNSTKRSYLVNSFEAYNNKIIGIKSGSLGKNSLKIIKTTSNQRDINKPLIAHNYIKSEANIKMTSNILNFTKNKVKLNKERKDSKYKIDYSGNFNISSRPMTTTNNCSFNQKNYSISKIKIEEIGSKRLNNQSKKKLSKAKKNIHINSLIGEIFTKPTKISTSNSPNTSLTGQIIKKNLIETKNNTILKSMW